MSAHRARVRVTADAVTRPLGVARGAAPTRGIALPGSPTADAEAAYVRSLMRAQLRLALVTVVGFIAVAAALAAALTWTPGVDDIVVWGIPLSWLLHAFAFYPLLVVFAVLYRLAAARNERRYRALREDG